MKNIFTIKRVTIATATLVALGVLAYQFELTTWKRSFQVVNSLLTESQGQSVMTLSSGIKKYSHPLLGFSFEYPATFSISSFGSPDDDAGETILLQGSKEEKGLQVLITPFDEDIVLTEGRIHQDIPDLMMSDVSMRTLGTGEKTVRAIVFMSTNSFMGKSREAWFVRNGQLYQLSAPAVAQDVFTKALDSWEF